ncbi:MAG: PQQ-binding-like beta-propeller repeat protein [Acidobacteriia bacterium]|nr:PQQ-binding-like beta-propeller repeat protein [Terriglobia bacterium]
MRRSLALLTAILVPGLVGQSKTPAADWPMFNRDLASTRYSPLSQITTANVAKLAQVWSYRLQPSSFRFATAGGAAEVVPIVVNGVMYISTQTRVVALNPESGKEIWNYDVAGGQASPRGVAYWPGDRQNPPRIMFTNGRNLVALNASTGKLDPGFAKEGILDMVVPYNGVPTIFKNLVLVGASTGEKENGPPGNSRAYDARTGVKLWEFQSIPGPGQVGHESWLSDGWKDRSGANIWGWYMTADEERGILYMPFGAAAANYYGGDRPGANLFGNSVVAVDANTGKYKWHFQVVHHDLWDYDMPPAPGLVDIVKDGKKIPALAAMGKSGWMFILDRVTGKPVFGVEERAVPKGDVPGEWYSPTQPFPVKPPALARTSLKREDLVTADDTTPEHAKACLELWEKNLFYNAGPFTPWLFHEEGAPPRVTISFPGATGGASWGGMASDPKLGYIFVQTKDSPLTGWIEKKKDGTRYENANLPYDRVNGTAGAFAVGGLPCYKPPWSRIIAVNANTGDIAWQTTLGTNQSLPEGKRNVGGSGSAGPMVTAGGLVFIGAATDNRFRAFDSKTGRELWAGQLERQGNAVPMTYQAKNGKQYVAVTASDTVVVFGLP